MASPGGYYYAPPPPRPRSIAGPLILIAIGVIFLLRNIGYSIPILHDFARYWPVLLLAIGLVRLAEFFYARSTGRPAPYMGGGSVFLLVIIIIIGITLFARHGEQINFGPWHDDFNVDDNFMHLFGNEYSFNGEANAPITEGGTLHVNCERGNISVSQWDQPQVKVEWRKRVFAGSQGEADSTNQATTPRFQTQGSTVELTGNTEAAGQKGVATDLEIYLPLKADLEVNAGHGDVSITQRTGDIRAVVKHGDVTVDQLTGNANITARHGSLHATNVNGNLTIDGRLDDLTLDSLSGSALVTADIFGDTRLAKLQKGVAIRTSRTTLEMARLDGELTMDSGDLKGENLQGPATLTTKAKDVDLQNVRGDLHISDDHGDISLQSGPSAALGNMDLTTHHGDVHLSLPSKANFQYQVMTRHGDITNDFGSSSTGGKNGNSSSASGTVGKGGVRVNVTSDTGDITLSRTEESLSAPPKPPNPPALPSKPEKPSKQGKKKVDQVDVL
jgi:DUF4097 and DUF4098 domain-containing protein YvlB